MEIEVKLALEPATQALLEQTLGRPIREVKQKDVYLATAGLPVALRLREDGDRAWVTLKSGFNKEGGIRTREEFEPAVKPEDVSTWMTVFERLGFPAAEVVEKTRREYEWGPVHVVIDQVQGLGTFVEVEVVGDEPQMARTALEKALTELGLDTLPRITDSYRDLLRQAGAYR